MLKAKSTINLGPSTSSSTAAATTTTTTTTPIDVEFFCKWYRSPRGPKCRPVQFIFFKYFLFQTFITDWYTENFKYSRLARVLQNGRIFNETYLFEYEHTIILDVWKLGCQHGGGLCGVSSMQGIFWNMRHRQYFNKIPEMYFSRYENTFVWEQLAHRGYWMICVNTRE